VVIFIKIYSSYVYEILLKILTKVVENFGKTISKIIFQPQISQSQIGQGFV